MICPQCNNEVSVTEAQYLSMYTCGKCQAVYFIDITGQPEFGDMSEQLPVEELYLPDENISSENTLNELPEASFSNDLQSEILNDVQSDFTNQLSSDINPFENSGQEDITGSTVTSPFGAAANEITDFANQDGAVSALSYDLLVTGLDSKETTVLFKEAIEDSKFGWVSQEIFLKIKNGQCEFKNLNPIQAFVLAKRIQFLDIEMQWKQNVQV